MSKVEAMLVEPFIDNPMRRDRVEQLRELYARPEYQEVSPFTDGTANFPAFRDNYVGFQNMLANHLG